MRTVPVVLACALLLGARPAAAADAAAAPRATGPDTAFVQLGDPGPGTHAFVARPAGQPVAAIVVVHEWWGLNTQIRGIALRLASQGYLAIVPDLYHGKVATEAENAHELMRALDDERALADLDAAAAWIRAQPGRAKSRIGVLGFCMGGSHALQFALHSSSVAAVVMFYGRPVTDSEKLAALKAPLLAHFGALDQGLGPDRAEEFKTALKEARKDASVYVYPGAGHAFMNEARDSYHPDAARLAWARTLAFFQKTLKG